MLPSLKRPEVSTATTCRRSLMRGEQDAQAVFHAYSVYLFAHIWFTDSVLSRIFGQNIRINGLPNARIILIQRQMRFPLYPRINILIWIACSSASH